MTIEEILRLRDQVWDEHPLIIERAVLPTLAAKDVLARVWALGRKGRGSIAFFAQPLSGKSSCAELLFVEMKRKKPGCGVLIFEVVEDTNPAEGRLLSEILNQIDYAPKIARDLAGKRTQVHRALLSLSGEARHLFLIFDEAQELSCDEFAWLKSVINRLVRDRVKVTVVLFGQIELKEKRQQLKAARSDLEKRFMSTLNEFRGIQNAAELEPLLAAIDAGSEFPVGSGMSYLQLLLPRFYEGGGRLVSSSALFWRELKQQRLPGVGTVVAMSSVAGFLASFFIHLRGADSEELKITSELLQKIDVI
ncbi:ATP-binding protein [Xanthomonas arboricola]|uniref:Type II secretory pathway predicted ATPase ExeA n=1 Tax=Xanthomonas arboricola TaxID=56448 RepID=A0AB73H3Y6_9XANT|nr:ATP-binding protein [Xanthomonas arboricola]MBB5672891.1 type II secretory pathway predicted ATPase ExeA [Xanthomonas arboricola]